MDERDDLLLLERALAEALTARYPRRVLAAAAGDAAGPSRGAIAAIDADGLHVATLLVARFRFDRLMNASDRARAWFARYAAGFSSAFRKSHEAVPPTASHPQAERLAFELWLAER